MRVWNRLGVSLVEVCFLVAILGSVGIMTHGRMTESFSGAADLQRMHEAEALANSMLAVMLELPLDEIEIAHFRGRKIDIPDQLGEFLQTNSRLEVETEIWKIEGEIPRRGMSVTVPWKTSGGRSRSVRREASRAYSGSSLRGGPSPGARLRAKDPGWGRQERWVGTSSASKSTGPSSFGFDRPPEVQAQQELAKMAQHSLYTPEDQKVGEARFQPSFFSDPKDFPSNFSPRLPTTVRIRKQNKSWRRRRFLRNTGLTPKGLASLEVEGQEIPDGLYPYRLEVLDTRDEGGRGPVVGVFTLQGEGESYSFVAKTRTRPLSVREFLGDEVLSREVWVDPQGVLSEVLRTEAHWIRVFEIEETGRRFLELRALPGFDPEVPGTRATQEFEAEQRSRLSLEPSSHRFEDPLLEALHADFFRSEPAGL